MGVVVVVSVRHLLFECIDGLLSDSDGLFARGGCFVEFLDGLGAELGLPGDRRQLLGFHLETHRTLTHVRVTWEEGRVDMEWG